MKKRTRLVLTIFAWSAFLVIAPPLLFYSFGYRLTPSDPVPVSIGTFLVRTLPSRARVFINNVEEQGKTPLSTRSLTTGTYTVRIERDGYRPWQKDLPITGTHVTDIRNVLLLPLRIETGVVRANVWESFLSSQEQYLLLREQTTTGQPHLRIVRAGNETADGTIVQGIRPRETIRDVHWSPNEQWVACTLTTGTSTRVLLISVASGESTVLPKGDIVGWSPLQNDSLLLQQKTSLLQVSTAASISPQHISDTVTAAAQSGTLIALAERENGKNTFRLLAQNRERSLPTPTSGDIHVNEIAVEPGGFVAVSDTLGGHLYVWDPLAETWHNIPRVARHLMWSPDGRKLLWQSETTDAWVMNIHEDRSDLVPLVPELVDRRSTALRALQWFPDSQHVLFFDRDILFLADIDSRNGHRIEPLLGSNRGDGTVSTLQNGEEILLPLVQGTNHTLVRAFLRVPADR